MDEVKFLSTNIINRLQKHFEKIGSCESVEGIKNFYSVSFLVKNEETELTFLRKFSNFVLKQFLPSNYSDSYYMRILLSEIVAAQVLFKIINYICDPDYINQKLLDYLKWYKLETEKHCRSYAYAETFEEFVKIINKCSTVEELKMIRHYIATEIMQVTAINDVKKERSANFEKGKIDEPVSSTKGDLLQARNLRRYLNQLSFAKALCEKRISTLCGFEDIDVPSTSSPKRKPILSFKVIMDSDLCRSYFRRFMQYSGGMTTSSAETRKYLVLFWESVDEMKKQNITKQYQIASEILNHSQFMPSVNRHIKLSKIALKGMEEFVLGNKGPESFYEAQGFVYEKLESRYYPLFIVSKEYDEMIDQFEENEQQRSSTSEDTTDYPKISVEECHNSFEKSISLHEKSKDCFSLQMNATKTKLENVKRKLKDKTQAFEAINCDETRSVKTVNSTINTKLKLVLVKEIEELELEKNFLEGHLEFTQLWKENIGQWITQVESVEMCEKVDKENYLVLIIVYPQSEEQTSRGWVVTRTSQEFREFRNKVLKMVPALKSLDFPFIKRSKQTITAKDCKAMLQNFLDIVMRNDTISKSEDLYLFLLQSPEHLRHSLSQSPLSTISKTKFPFANLFGVHSSQTITRLHSNESDDESEKNFLLFKDCDLEENKDDVAEPLYRLISEVFELKGVFNLLRKTIMIFVQITFGKTINKQIKETVEWVCSESMIQYYLTTFRDSMWPSTPLEVTSRSSSDRRKTQILAKQYLLDWCPTLMYDLFGQQNARKGLIKIFDAMQNATLNKQLFYVSREKTNQSFINLNFELQEIMESFMFELIPELKTL